MYFKNSSLAHRDFIRYAEKFRTLARLAEYEDDYLIDRLRKVIPSNMKLLVVASKDTLSDEWAGFLDELLAFYKDLYPERVQDHIFTKGNSSKGDSSAPMEVDRAEKKKWGKDKKKKGKEVNSTEKSKKFCEIHKTHGHSTDQCRLNPKASKPEEEKKEYKKYDPKGKGKEKASSSAKKIRAVESDSDSDSSSSESDAPPPKRSKKSSKKKEVNSLRVASTARVEELPDDDELLDSLKRGKPFDPAGFLARYL